MTTPSKLLCIGECMVELSLTSDGTYSMAFAGDTFNTAWYFRQAASADWQVSYLSTVGADNLSRDMLKFMQEAGISIEYVTRSANATPGLYMINLDNGERSFSYWRSQSAARTLADDPSHLAQAMDASDVIYFSGITLAILPNAGRNNLLEALKAARAKGKLIVFDTNLRPALWPDTTTMCAEISRAATVSDIVLPSFDDEAKYFDDANAKATVARYQALGSALVVVKNGAGEVLAADNATVTRFSPNPSVEMVDTTAAGDSFNAGFLAAYLSGKSIVTSLKLATDLSAKVIQQHGALVYI